MNGQSGPNQRPAATPTPPGRRSRVNVRKSTPSSWAEETRGRRSVGGHKRSASWGSAEHLREVAKLRHQLQKRCRHGAPPAGYQPPQQPAAPPAGYEPPQQPAGPPATATQTAPLMPLNRFAPRLRRSVEGLNLELEEVFVCEKADDQIILDIPDGHRAPAPTQRCSSGSQSEPSPGPLDPSLLSPSQSPGPLDPSLLSPSQSPCPLDPSLLSPSQSPCPLDPSLLSPSQSPCPLDPSLLSPSQSPCPLDPSLLSPSQSPCAVDAPPLSPCPIAGREPVDCETLSPSGSTSLLSRWMSLDPLLQSSSPRPSKTHSFLHEPPEGCDRVRVCQDAVSACQEEPLLQLSCPDPNKVNFTPNGGSAFCPVSLLKPLLPSMDLLFRGLSVSPVTGGPTQASPTRQLGLP